MPLLLRAIATEVLLCNNGLQVCVTIEGPDIPYNFILATTQVDAEAARIEVEGRLAELGIDTDQLLRGA